VSKVTLCRSEESPEAIEDADGVVAKATLARGEKCPRCWIRSETVGEVREHPQLCSRCAERVSILGTRQ